MSEKQKKLDIRQAITLCDYNNKIKNNFIIFLQSNIQIQKINYIYLKGIKIVQKYFYYY